MSDHAELPPSYTARAEDYLATASSPSSSSGRPPRRHVTVPTSGAQAFPNAINHHCVSMTRGSIKDKWVIDPMRHVPSSLRYGESATKKANLRLETLHGNICADVTLVQSAPNDSTVKTTILFVKTQYGNIDFRLVSKQIHFPPVQEANLNLFDRTIICRLIHAG
jgi:hypothetical protein